MSWKSLVCAGLLCALASPAMADPSLSASLVTSGGNPVLGANGGLQWAVTITPDGALAAGGNGSIAAEVGFTLTHLGFAAVTTNTADWDHENAGVSPFGGWVFTDGVETNINEVMAALGSINFPDGTPSTMITIETAEPYYVNAGDYLLTSQLDVSGAYGGNGRLAQGATNYDNATGTYSHSIVPGDADLNGGAGAADYDIWKLGVGDKWSNADFDNSGAVGAADYDIWKYSAGTTLPPLGSGALAAGAVPEPSSLVLALVLGLALTAARRGRLV